MEFLRTIVSTALSTALDVAPIVGILVLFQVAVLRRNLPNLRRIAAGFVLVLLGLTLFLIGLEEALFPIGETMARQLTAPETIGEASLADGVDWYDYLLGLRFCRSDRLCDDSGRALAHRGRAQGRGDLGRRDRRLGPQNRRGGRGGHGGWRWAAFALSRARPCRGTSLPHTLVVIAQTFRSSRTIVPLAYDSGGVTTSTVTVPVVAALGLGLAATVPGRSPLIDGFGLIAFASVFPIMSVLGYAMVVSWVSRRRNANLSEET